MSSQKPDNDLDPKEDRKKNSSSNSSKKSFTTSKRFISEKIEEMFRMPPDDSKEKTTEDKNNFQTVSEDPNISFDNTSKGESLQKEKQISPKQSWVDTLLKYPLLVFLGIVVALGWGYFFIAHYSQVSSSSIGSIQLEKFWEWKGNAPIFSTPIITDINNNGEYDLAFADNLGYLRAVNSRTKELIYQTYLGGAVVGSLAKLDVDGKKPEEIFVSTKNGKFFIINQQGEYFYQSRVEYFKESLFSKPVVLSIQKSFYLAGMGGQVWGLKNSYGEVLWVNDNSALALNQEGIFASPVLIQTPLKDTSSSSKGYLTDTSLSLLEFSEHYALAVVGESGTVATFNLATGGLWWQKNFDDVFKATPIVITTKKNKVKDYLILAGVRGGIWLLDNQGELVDKVKLKDAFVSSPVLGRYLPSSDEEMSQQVLLTSQLGNVFLAYIVHQENQVRLRLEQLQAGNKSFIATPVVADFNQDGWDDILAVTREGTLWLWAIDQKIVPGTENRLKEWIPPYRLGYKVTATPVVGDLNHDGHVEVVIGGENGRISVLTLRTSPKAVFSPDQIISPEFLKNAFNSR